MKELDDLVRSGMLKSYQYTMLTKEQEDRYEHETITLEFPNGQTLVIESGTYGYGDSGSKLYMEVN